LVLHKQTCLKHCDTHHGTNFRNIYDSRKFRGFVQELFSKIVTLSKEDYSKNLKTRLWYFTNTLVFRIVTITTEQIIGLPYPVDISLKDLSPILFDCDPF